MSTISTSRPYLANMPSRLAIHPGQKVAAGDAYATTSFVICPPAFSRSAMSKTKLKPKIIFFIVMDHIVRIDGELKPVERRMSSTARSNIFRSLETFVDCAIHKLKFQGHPYGVAEFKQEQTHATSCDGNRRGRLSYLHVSSRIRYSVQSVSHRR